MPNDQTYIRSTVEASVKAAKATREAAEAERTRLPYDSIETANDPLVQKARAALALMGEQEAEAKAKEDAKKGG